MIRVLDVLVAIFGLVIGSPVLAVLTILGLFDTGSPFFRQRCGRC